MVIVARRKNRRKNESRYNSLRRNDADAVRAKLAGARDVYECLFMREKQAFVYFPRAKYAKSVRSDFAEYYRRVYSRCRCIFFGISSVLVQRGVAESPSPARQAGPTDGRFGSTMHGASDCIHGPNRP